LTDGARFALRNAEDQEPTEVEAIYEFDVVDMPVTVAVDAGGTSAHITGPAEWQKRIASGEFKTIEIASA
jgi:fumarate hydratase class I